MDMISTRWLAEHYKHDVGIGKPEGRYQECYRPIGYKKVTSSGWLKCGLFYGGNETGRFCIWTVGDVKPKNGKPITGQATFSWYKTKEWQDDITVHYTLTDNGVQIDLG